MRNHAALVLVFFPAVVAAQTLPRPTVPRVPAPGSVNQPKPSVTASHLSAGWTLEPSYRIFSCTSTSTLRFADNSLRTYYAGINYSVSRDGLNWSPTIATSVRPRSSTFYRNPAVIFKADSSMVMIYEEVYKIGSQDGMRFYRATSPKGGGVSFTITPGSGTDGAVLEGQANEKFFVSVPDLIWSNTSTLRIYFVAGGDHIETAVSADEGITWTREGRISISGLSPSRQTVDPDVIYTDDGFYLLFFAAPPEGAPSLSSLRILSAQSRDGRSFVLDPGERVPVTTATQTRLDPDVVRVSATGHYRMFFGDSPNPANIGYNLASAFCMP